MDIRGTGITREGITAITEVIHITEPITTMVGRITTAAIDITSITSDITAIKTQRLV
jgi:hypothetical protein